MTRDEWLQIGYEKRLIDDVAESEMLSFRDAYKMWFKMKINRIRPQSCDRIEVTYNRYFLLSDFIDKPIHAISEEVIYDFINSLIIKNGNITYKEYQRIYQICNNVMQYAFDLRLGRCYCVNWSIVKRYIALDNMKRVEYNDLCVSDEVRARLFRSIVRDHIYEQKQSACLCLLLNFYLGLRVGELASLSWSDIDLPGGCIRVRTTQTKSCMRAADGTRIGATKYDVQDRTKTDHGNRVVPLVNDSKYILDLLLKWHRYKKYDSPYLAYDGTDTILSKSLERTLYRLCDLLDVPRFNTHRIRKTFATVLHNSGVPTKVISDLLGHAEIRTTERNYILSSEDALDVVRESMRRVHIIDLSERGCMYE